MRIAVVALALALVLPGLIAGPASAQYYPAPQGFSATATATSFAPETPNVDQVGNYLEAATSGGTVQGSHINGTFTSEETRYSAVNSPAGTIQGSFNLMDANGSSIYGSLNGQYAMGAVGTTAQGQFTITGGSGIYAGASGSGSFTEQLGGPGGAPVLSLSGQLFGQAAYAPYQYTPAQYVPAYVPTQSETVPSTQPLPDQTVYLPGQQATTTTSALTAPTFYAPPWTPSSSFTDPNTGVYYTVTPCSAAAGYSVTPSLGSVAPRSASASNGVGGSYATVPTAGGPAC